MTRYRESARIAELISRLLRDIISETEERELASRLENNGLNDAELLERFIGQDFAPAEDYAAKEMEDAVWDAVKERMRIPARPRRTRRFVRIAAAAAVVAAGVFAVFYISGRGDFAEQGSTVELAAYEPTLAFPGGEVLTIPAEVEVRDILHEKTDAAAETQGNLKISIPKGMMYTFTMDDGTVVHLFPETQLQFPRSFDGPERRVVLDGEAFFEVARNERQPFIVSAPGASVRVLGTSFNVKAYNNQPTVEAVLVSGSVDINDHVLSPNHLAVVTRSDGKVDITAVNGELYRERAGGAWVFDYLPLETIMQELGRWFEFEYEYADPGLMNKRFRFKLPNTSNFSRITELMEKTGEVTFNVKGNKIVISQ